MSYTEADINKKIEAIEKDIENYELEFKRVVIRVDENGYPVNFNEIKEKIGRYEEIIERLKVEIRRVKDLLLPSSYLTKARPVWLAKLKKLEIRVAEMSIAREEENNSLSKFERPKI